MIYFLIIWLIGAFLNYGFEFSFWSFCGFENKKEYRLRLIQSVIDSLLLGPIGLLIILWITKGRFGFKLK